jgi:polyisoprenoid-binding protein YceI
MKKIALSIVLLAFVAVFTGFKNPDAVYNVDAEASQLKWTGYHLAKSYEHIGFVKIKSGKLATANGTITSGEFVIDMNTISNTDVTDGEKNGKLVGHLKSADFFDVANNPEAKLVIKKSTAAANGKLKATGDLTIRGITKSIDFEATLNETGSQVEATADLKIVRTDFNVMYGWKVENAMLSGEFRMEVKLVAKK